MRALLRPLGVLLTLAAWATPTLAQSGMGGTPPTVEAPAPTSNERLPGVVEIIDATGPDGQAFPVERVKIGVPGGEKPEVIYTMTAGGGTIYAAHLQKERFKRDPLPQINGVPDEKLARVCEKPADSPDAPCPIDIISTWDPGFLPYRVDFKSIQVADTVTRIVRRARGGTVKAGSIIAPTADEAKKFAVNRPVVIGDTLVITAPASIAGEYKVNLVGPGGSITPAKPLAVQDVTGVAYEIKRVGDFGSLYATDPYFTRVTKEPGFPLTYVWPDPNVDSSPFYVEKHFTLGQNPYSLELRVTLYNVGDKPISAQPGLTITGWQHPASEGGGMFQRPTDIQGATCHTNETLEHAPFNAMQSEAIDAVKAGQPARSVHSYTTPTDFIGVDTAYFAALAAPKRLSTGQCTQDMVIYDLNVPGAWSIAASYFTSASTTISAGANACRPEWLIQGDAEHRTCEQALATLGNLPTGASMKSIDGAWKKLRETASVDERANIDRARQELVEASQAAPHYDFVLYTGPKDQHLLREAAPILEKDVDLGMFSFIAKPLHSLLVWLHGGVGSWALAIILLTVVVKLVLLPLTNKSYRSMQKMQKLKPKLDELKKKIGDDKQKFAQEQMALFKREGVNPLTGCFPMLLQMPVWFGLYQSIQTSVELYRAPMGLWIHDLSAPDPYYVMPILLGILMFVQTLLTATATMDGLQGKIMKYGMPIMFSAFMLFLPSGLVLYIFVNIALTIVQNIVIKRRMSTT
ncbi:MAG: membrane protein insertase YidC [Deltaproteobacteria bacterium]|nr:MAG: membrane protein insertase YidC [Deltaproteobacteria bacterium]